LTISATNKSGILEDTNNCKRRLSIPQNALSHFWDNCPTFHIYVVPDDVRMSASTPKGVVQAKGKEKIPHLNAKGCSVLLGGESEKDEDKKENMGDRHNSTVGVRCWSSCIYCKQRISSEKC
jgi:hypothetical protein